MKGEHRLLSAPSFRLKHGLCSFGLRLGSGGPKLGFCSAGHATRRHPPGERDEAGPGAMRLSVRLQLVIAGLTSAITSGPTPQEASTNAIDACVRASVASSERGVVALRTAWRAEGLISRGLECQHGSQGVNVHLGYCVRDELESYGFQAATYLHKSLPWCTIRLLRAGWLFTRAPLDRRGPASSQDEANYRYGNWTGRRACNATDTPEAYARSRLALFHGNRTGPQRAPAPGPTLEHPFVFKLPTALALAQNGELKQYVPAAHAPGDVPPQRENFLRVQFMGKFARKGIACRNAKWSRALARQRAYVAAAAAAGVWEWATPLYNQLGFAWRAEDVDAVFYHDVRSAPTVEDAATERRISRAALAAALELGRLLASTLNKDSGARKPASGRRAGPMVSAHSGAIAPVPIVALAPNAECYDARATMDRLARGGELDAGVGIQPLQPSPQLRAACTRAISGAPFVVSPPSPGEQRTMRLKRQNRVEG
mmetsp:Transcript_21616/g.72714  ORF Transcript_21616/g.72714 Transcript_21616/m.72714 type:complete len:485 (+) Transcript_21616:540-1994(+)